MAFRIFRWAALAGLGYAAWKYFSVEKEVNVSKRDHWQVEAIKPADNPLALSLQVMQYQTKVVDLGKDTLPIRAGIPLNKGREEIITLLIDLNYRFNVLFAQYREVLFCANDLLEEHGMESYTFYWEISINDKDVEIDTSLDNEYFTVEVGEVCNFMVEYTGKVLEATQNICASLDRIAEKQFKEI